MRMRLALVPLVALLAGIPCTVVRGELLATFEATVQGTDTGHAYFDVADVDFVFGDELARVFDDASLAPADVPVLFEATSQSDSGFDAAAALFTDGQPNEFEIAFTGASGGGIGVGTNDCALFFGDYECNAGVDLQGGRIDRFTLLVRELTLEPEGGFGTAIYADVALEVYGVPEPSAAALAACAVSALGAAARLGAREPGRRPARYAVARRVCAVPWCASSHSVTRG